MQDFSVRESEGTHRGGSPQPSACVLLPSSGDWSPIPHRTSLVHPWISGRESHHHHHHQVGLCPSSRERFLSRGATPHRSLHTPASSVSPSFPPAPLSFSGEKPGFPSTLPKRPHPSPTWALVSEWIVSVLWESPLQSKVLLADSKSVPRPPCLAWG